MKVECSLSLSINEKPVELLGEFVSVKEGEEGGGVSVGLTEESKQTLNEEPLGHLGDISTGFENALGLKDQGLLTQITGQLGKIKAIESAVETFNSTALYLTALEFQSGKKFVIGIRLGGVNDPVPLTLLSGIQVISLGVQLTINLDSSE